MRGRYFGRSSMAANRETMTARSGQANASHRYSAIGGENTRTFDCWIRIVAATSEIPSKCASQPLCNINRGGEHEDDLIAFLQTPDRIKRRCGGVISRDRFIRARVQDTDLRTRTENAEHNCLLRGG
mmetsp:Transcript_7713/g.16370  ORF Transcript_7713/g.16370 Transcript_7713/m.16370 type:complete len:127 (-) Transcript_7713:4-384(-)